MISPGTDTEHELALLGGDQFQQLVDELLPSYDARFAGLKSSGLNKEGKSIKGHPDSYVGKSPKEASVAVEYTTQATAQEKKFEKDYDSVRTASPKAKLIALCTSRDTSTLDLVKLKERAKTDGIELRIIDIKTITDTLNNKRQDLRFYYLRIPPNNLTAVTLKHLLQNKAKTLAEERGLHTALSRYVHRAELDRNTLDFIHNTKKKILAISAPSGTGKSTWSLYWHERLSGARICLWSQATELPFSSVDPISTWIIQNVYGTHDPAKILELSGLLTRSSEPLVLIIDAIDESSDYSILSRAFTTLLSGALGKHIKLILLLREEARPLLSDEINKLGHSIGSSVELWHIAELSKDEATILLAKEGVSEQDFSSTISLIPKEYQGNPFYLKLAIDLRKLGAAPSSPDVIVAAAICEKIKEMSTRLKYEGRKPSLQWIEGTLEKLAEIALLSDDGLVSPLSLREILGEFSNWEGENSLLTRAESAGLLRARPDGAVHFTHALFMEHLAAQSLMKKKTESLPELLKTLPLQRARSLAVRLLPKLAVNNEAISALLDRDYLLACECIGAVSVKLSAKAEGDLIAAAQLALESQFDSDVRVGLRLLASVRSKDAIEVAVDWFNHLDPEVRVHWLNDSSEMFIKLELIGAAEVIALGSQFWHPLGWYAKSDTDKLDSLSQQFRLSLADIAYKSLLEANGAPGPTHRFAQLLAKLRDSRLVEWLELQSQVRCLTDAEHRALIHIGTKEAIDLFARSVDMVLDQLDVENDETKRGQLWYSIILKHSDIREHSNENLIDLIDCALSSNRPLHVSFGLDWAEFLHSSKLLESYAGALQRFPRSLAALSAKMFDSVVRDMRPEDLVTAFDRSKDYNLKRHLVWSAHEAPGNETELFLIDLLPVERYRRPAIHSLGELRSVKSAPLLHKLLLETSDQTEIIISSLGRIRYNPAVDAIKTILLKLYNDSKGRELTTQESNLEFSIIRTLGQIGGPDAHAALGEAHEWGKSKRHILEALFASKESSGISVLKNVAAKNQFTGSHIASVLNPQSIFKNESFHVDFDPDPWIEDEGLLDETIKEAARQIGSGEYNAMSRILTTITEFKSLQARSYLESIAAGDVGKYLSPPNNTNFSIAADPVKDARKLLARMGHDKYAREEIASEMDSIVSKKHIFSSDISILFKWPRSLVLQHIRSRVGDDRNNVGWTYLLAIFAEANDVPVFQKLAESGPSSVADVAHQFLRGTLRSG